MSSRGPATALHSSVDRGRRAVLICEPVASFPGAGYGAERGAIVRKVEQNMRRGGRLSVAVLLGTLLSGAYRDARGQPTSGDEASCSSRRSPPSAGRALALVASLGVAVSALTGTLPVPVVESRGVPPQATGTSPQGSGASTLRVRWIPIGQATNGLSASARDWIWQLRAKQWNPQHPASPAHLSRR